MNSIGPRASIAAGFLVLLFSFAQVGGDEQKAELAPEFVSQIKPLVQKYCIACHSTKTHKGSLDLERFTSVEQVRKDLKPWQAVIEMLEAKEMPPKEKPQPTDAERRRLLAWSRNFLDSEARSHAGDPGRVPMRRLSNAEYNYTIRDLTGVDLQPAREFPADGAAGEGFTNAAESLSEISPALLGKYLQSAKDIAEHAVLLPDGFRFSSAKTRRDWTNETLASLKAFFSEYTPDGKLPVQPYLLATIRHRAEIAFGSIAVVAAKEKLNAKYLGILWQTLTANDPSFPLDGIRSRWRTATEKDVPALTAEIIDWQTKLWKFVKIGSYADGNEVRQLANNPPAAEVQTLRLNPRPKAGRNEVVLYLASREILAGGKGGHVVWGRPRFEGKEQATLLLRDYADFGSRYEMDAASLYAQTEKYLAAAIEATQERSLTRTEVAAKHSVDVDWLKRWIEVLELEPAGPVTDPMQGPQLPALKLLDDRNPENKDKPSIKGWKKKGIDLPVLITNASDKTLLLPGTIGPNKVAVHPTPKEFVGVAWKSPLTGRVQITGKVTHAHPACGNGVAWWVEHRRDNRGIVLAEGLLDLGKSASIPVKTVHVAKGDVLLLVVDAREENHVCDLTEIDFTLTSAQEPKQIWDLAADISGTVLVGNPHADKFGNKEAWSFVRGPGRPAGSNGKSSIPVGSLLARWRNTISRPAERAQANKLASELQALLTGPRPAKENDPDQVLYDKLLSVDGPLLHGLELSRIAKPKPHEHAYGLAKDRFGRHPDGKPAEEAGLVVNMNDVIEVHLPAGLFRNREFVVDVKRDIDAAGRAVQFQVFTSPPYPHTFWDGPVIAAPTGENYKQMIRGFDDFRRCFPQFICFPQIIPTDEVVCLKLYHREDEPLVRLFLNESETHRLEKLWAEHRFISQWPITEHKNLPLFIGFVTQDQPKELVTYFEGKREPFRLRAEKFEAELTAAQPRHLETLLDFAARAYRRPLVAKEKEELLGLYQSLRKKNASHDDAFRGVLSRVLVSPSFLFRVEQAPPGKDAAPVDDWELATRLSYFLWSTMPDEELRRLALAGKLRDPLILRAQTKRMLKDSKTRALGIEFGTQLIHVRGFDELKEKNETLFPSFDDKLRKAIYEESILFFQDLFQNDRPVTALLDADYTFLDESLAKHYGIPGVSGPQWRKVDGVKKYGRGGILGLASIQTKESGASRTSPVLRGNWVVETLLGEKLPRPPPDVPRLPEEEGGSDGLTMRQRVEQHTRVAQCAVCHVRIDPFGFALEKYDPIGRLREKDLGGHGVDSRVKLKDGTEFEGLDGLRGYLLSKKKDVVVRLFCRKLLGYALGRSVALSDQTLLDEMVAELDKNGGRLSAAVLAVVRSPQFRSIRGADYSPEE